MIVYTIFRLNWNRTRYDNVDDLKIKNGLVIERYVLGCAGKLEEGGGRWMKESG